MQELQDSKAQSFMHVLCMNEVTTRCNRSRSSIYLDISKGTFPKPIKMGSSSRWLESDINNWLAGLVAQREKC